MRCQNTVVLHVRSLVAALVNKTGVTLCVCVCVCAGRCIFCSAKMFFCCLFFLL